MLLTKATTYGLRAVFDIAYYGAGQPQKIGDIAGRQKISRTYLEQIFKKLVQAGLLQSRRGVGGGYVLSRAATDITIGDVIDAADGRRVAVAVNCLADSQNREGQCEILEQCVTRHIWRQTEKLLQDYYASITIHDLCILARIKGL